MKGKQEEDLERQGKITVLVSYEREIEKFTALLKGVRTHRIQSEKTVQGSLFGRDVKVLFSGRKGGLYPKLHVGSADIVISTGICGALLPSLRCGDIVVSERVLLLGEPEKEALFSGTGGKSLQGLEVPEGACVFDIISESRCFVPHETFLGVTVTVEKPMPTAAEKLITGERTGCAAVDMEDFFRLVSAKRQGARFLSIRAVYDEASFDIRPGEDRLDKTRLEESSESIARVLSLVIENGLDFT